ncbi:hypothetical protein HDU76_014107, partial [Blyttiomyces sp. JEL0837]
VVQVNESCGGNRVDAPVCASRLFCDYTGRIPDAGGVCKPQVKVVQLNESCGGNMSNAPVCAEGLFCDHTGRNPDGAGVCHQSQ